MTYHGYDAHGQLVEKMWKCLGEDQIRQLMIRMIDSRIKMKEHWIEQMQYKIETYQMARDMLEQGQKKKQEKQKGSEKTL
ncbi:hypothetical protein ABH15_04065 [Methanoculleus taiwanensis]|uniref:Uncharacterized protein n=1 Tax=Methanoculleus taiwanensis TaxID=1550565 RepID=A0A498H6P2_9EURY|nr:hypothetical protein [Methanoculleus taiwanensis]RXE57286.1 hypothetical protein ABH15_04065 [Methanoculleus taiwanensis]